MFSPFVHPKYREAVTILCLCLIWYIVSSANGVVGKLVLSDFPYPMTVTMVQLLSISVYLIPILKSTTIKGNNWGLFHLPIKYWCQMILPLALGKFIASVSSHISLWKVPVSYAHTVKATMPFFTVLLSRVILKERQSKQVYFALVPIICGVVIASLTELSFDLIGLISALVSTIGFSVQNIFSKKCLKDTSLHEFGLLFTLAVIAGILFFPLWVVYDLSRIINDTSLSRSSHTPRLIALLIIDGLCNFAQNLVAFSIIAMVTPLSYAVANCTKRIVVVSVSLFLLRNPVTFINVIGMIMAIFGVLMYNKAKYDQYREKCKLPVLPNFEIVNIESKMDNDIIILPMINDIDHYPSNMIYNDYNIFSNGEITYARDSNGLLPTQIKANNKMTGHYIDLNNLQTNQSNDHFNINGLTNLIPNSLITGSDKFKYSSNDSQHNINTNHHHNDKLIKDNFFNYSSKKNMTSVKRINSTFIA